MDRDSNFYTFLFATVMVLAVASVLAFTSQSLKDLQKGVLKRSTKGGHEKIYVKNGGIGQSKEKRSGG